MQKRIGTSAFVPRGGTTVDRKVASFFAPRGFKREEASKDRRIPPRFTPRDFVTPRVAG